MMGYIWCAMLLLSILMGGKAPLTSAAMQGAEAALKLCLSIGGALCLWSGVAKVMERSGLIRTIGKLLQPIFAKLFPKASRDPEALGYLTANVSANLLGLGNAATPMGIAAVKRMQRLEKTQQASDEMCLLIVMNTASIQLLPTTVATVRASLGAASPFDILPAVWLSSVCSVSAGIFAAKLFGRFSR